MAEIPKPAFHSTLSFPSELGLGGASFDGSLILKMVVPDEEDFGNRTERYSSVVLDIESLSQFTDKELTSSPRSSLQRTLSRKGSHRGERKTVEKETDETPKQASKGSSPNCTPEKSVVLPVTTELCNSQVVRRCSKRSSWIDPKRILFIFATLSGMGTVILIYFTLTIGKINGDDTQAQR